MIQLKQSILLSVFLLAGVYTSAQTTVNFTSTGTLEDAMVGNGGIEQMNFGSQNQMRVYYELNQQMANVFRTFIQFDVSSIPEEAIVTSATLKLYPQQVNNAENHPIYIERVDSNAWTEGSITWNNQPGVKTDQLAFSHAQTTSTSVHSFDVTNHVEKMVDYPNLNNGWRIRLQTESGSAPHGIVYHSSEATNSANHPVLTVQYIMPINLSTSVVHCTAGNTDGTMSVQVSGGSSADPTVLFNEIVQDTANPNNPSIVNVKATYNVQYNSVTNTITGDNLKPGIYLLRLLDNAYHTIGADAKFSFIKYILVGREGEITDGILHPSINYENDVFIARDEPGNNNPTDRANTNFSSQQDLRITDLVNNREEAALIKYNIDFDDQLDFIEVESRFRAWDKFFKLSGSSNAVNYSLITSDWDKRSVTWNTRPSIDSTLQIYLPTTPTNGFEQGILTDSVSLLPLVEFWQNNPTQNYGFEVALDSYDNPQYVNRDYRSPGYLYVRFEVKEPFVKTFNDTTDFGAISLEIPGYTLPYTYFISRDTIPSLNDIWDNIKDSTSIDSAYLFQGKVNSSEFTFNNLQNGHYHIAVFDNLGSEIFQKSTTLSEKPRLYSSVEIENSADSYQIMSGALSDGIATLYGSLSPNQQGGIEFQVSQLDTIYIGFNYLSDTKISRSTGMEFGVEINSNQLNIISGGFVSASFSISQFDKIQILKEYRAYTILQNGILIYTQPIYEELTEDLGVDIFIPIGSIATVEKLAYLHHFKSPSLKVTTTQPECPGISGSVQLTLPGTYFLFRTSNYSG